MWYYVTEAKADAFEKAAERIGETLTVCKEPPIGAELVFLERKDIPRGAVPGKCIAINREEPFALAGWDYAASGQIDADRLIRIGARLCGRGREDLRARAESCLDALSAPRHLLGYRYLCEAMMLCAEPDRKIPAMDELYPILAERRGTSAVMASRAIRHTIDRAWKDGDCAVQRSYFGYGAADTRGVPTNTEFLLCVCERMRMLQ